MEDKEGYGFIGCVPMHMDLYVWMRTGMKDINGHDAFVLTRVHIDGVACCAWELRIKMEMMDMELYVWVSMAMDVYVDAMNVKDMAGHPWIWMHVDAHVWIWIDKKSLMVMIDLHAYGRFSMHVCRFAVPRSINEACLIAVSYTHLTLPTTPYV